jgi:hypothetical protein
MSKFLKSVLPCEQSPPEARQLAEQLLSVAGPRFCRAAGLGAAPLTADGQVAPELD